MYLYAAPFCYISSSAGFSKRRQTFGFALVLQDCVLQVVSVDWAGVRGVGQQVGLTTDTDHSDWPPRPPVERVITGGLRAGSRGGGLGCPRCVQPTLSCPKPPPAQPEFWRNSSVCPSAPVISSPPWSAPGDEASPIASRTHHYHITRHVTPLDASTNAVNFAG